MKLKAIIIPWSELQANLDKYEEKIKFILPEVNGRIDLACIIIDEAA